MGGLFMFEVSVQHLLCVYDASSHSAALDPLTWSVVCLRSVGACPESSCRRSAAILQLKPKGWGFEVVRVVGCVRFQVVWSCRSGQVLRWFRGLGGSGAQVVHVLKVFRFLGFGVVH